jgi:hypothetical protein
MHVSIGRRTTMKNTAIALAMLTLSAAASALTPQISQAPPPEGGIVTGTGCVQAGERPGSFTLINIKWDAADAPAKNAGAHHDTPAPRPTAPAAGARPAQPSTVRLAGPIARLKVNEQVGHLVTVTGMLAMDDPIVTPGVVLPEPTGDTTSRQAEAARRAEAAPPRPPVLNLRSLTRVAAECK